MAALALYSLLQLPQKPVPAARKTVLTEAASSKMHPRASRRGKEPGWKEKKLSSLYRAPASSAWETLGPSPIEVFWEGRFSRDRDES